MHWEKSLCMLMISRDILSMLILANQCISCVYPGAPLTNFNDRKGGGSTELHILYPKKSPLQNKSLLFSVYPENPLVFFLQPKKILASFIDPKKSLMAKISDPKKSLGPPLPSLKYVSGVPECVYKEVCTVYMIPD